MISKQVGTITFIILIKDNIKAIQIIIFLIYINNFLESNSPKFILDC